MKLTYTQLQTIETYLLSWRLQFRDFYDELFDHYCTEVEQRMDAGKAFDEAFSDTSYLFSGHEFKPKTIFGTPSLMPRYFGPKAFEMEWYEALQNKNKSSLWNCFVKQASSLKIIYWILLYVLLYAVTATYELQSLWLISLLIPFLVYYVSLVILTGENKGKFNLKNVFKGVSPDGKRHNSKSTLIEARLTLVYQFNVLSGCAFFILNGLRIILDSTEMPVWIGCGITVAFSMLVAAQIEIIKQYRRRANLQFK